MAGSGWAKVTRDEEQKAFERNALRSNPRIAAICNKPVRGNNPRTRTHTKLEPPGNW